MPSIITINKKKAMGRTAEKLSFIITAVSALLLVIKFPNVIRNSAYSGMILCAKTIVPTLFPFMILSDLLLALSPNTGTGFFSKACEKAFGIGAACTVAIVCGMICGFPIGAVCTKALYDSGTIDKKDAESLLATATVPSFAFVISGIGEGMLGNVRVGVYLWLSCVFAAITVGIIFKSREKKIPIVRKIKKEPFNMTSSIKKSGACAVGISSFIIFFSVILGVLNELIGNEYVMIALSAILEISNAGNAVILSEAIPFCAKIPILGFALGFSGFSVMMQVMGVVSDSEIGCKTYFLRKLVQGIICSSFATLLILVF